MFNGGVEEDIADHAGIQTFIDDIIGAVAWGIAPDFLPVLRTFRGSPDLEGFYWRVKGASVQGYAANSMGARLPTELMDMDVFFGKKDEDVVHAAHSSGGIYIRFLPHMENSNSIASRLRLQGGKARHALLHELSHHLDHVRGIPVCSGSRDDTPYFDRPGEVRAYFHNIAAPLFAVHALAGTDTEGALGALKALGIGLDGDDDATAVRATLSRTRLAGPRAFLREASPHVLDALWERTGLLLSAVRGKVHGHGQDTSMHLAPH